MAIKAPKTDELRETENGQPKRIQRKRTKGWRMPPNTVYVGRPTKWGNPYIIGTRLNLTRKETVNLFRKYFAKWQTDLTEDVQEQLRGKDLACWCPLDQPCHADVLLEIANQPNNG